MRNKISSFGVKKILILTVVFLVVIVFSGCGLSGNNEEKPSGAESKKEEVINPFSPDSMVNTYENSKERIGDTVQMENDKINKALEESGLK